ncbi:MAG: hypothetical protein WCX48_11035 [Bacteroidales bacterium]
MMPVLVELNIDAQSLWRDDSSQNWENDSDHEWIDGQLLQISDRDYSSDTFWGNYLMELASPQYRLAQNYGGYCEMSFGSIKVSQDVFDDSDIWPAPQTMSITIYYTPDTESNKEIMFEGVGYRSEFDRSGISYDIYSPEFNAKLLSETYGYASTTQNISNDAAADLGGGLVGIPCPAHGYKDDDTIVINGTTNYDGSYDLPSQALGSGDVIVITATYAAENFGGTETIAYYGLVPLPMAMGTIKHCAVTRLMDVGGAPTYHAGYITGTLGTDWHIYDDGVNVDANVTDNGNNTFSLSVMAVGTITICGTGSVSTLDELFDWACGSSRLPLSFNNDNSRAVSPTISYWADSQMNIIDFLSDIAAYFTHMFYIRTSVLYLLDMATDNGSRTVTEYDYFPASYSDLAPLARLIGRWKENSAANETIGRFIRSSEYEEILVTNYPYGDDFTIDAYQSVRADVSASLDLIGTIWHKQRARIPIPIESNLPVPGEAISGTDISLKRDVDFAINARHIQYEIFSGVPKAVIEGEGTIS